MMYTSAYIGERDVDVVVATAEADVAARSTCTRKVMTVNACGEGRGRMRKVARLVTRIN